MTETIIYAIGLSPAVAAVLGCIFLFAKGVATLKRAAADISKRDDIVELVKENKILRQDLAKTTRSLRLLTDKIVKIQGYSDELLNDKED